VNISIKIVPNKMIPARKGFTGADWWFDADGNLEVRVAHEVGDWREQTLLAIHEATEAAMCKHLGITVAQVDEFDSKYQAEHTIDLNAGDEVDAPYKVPHNYATAIERILAGVLQVDWSPYDSRLSKL
jgi:hypothetical protein